MGRILYTTVLIMMVLLTSSLHLEGTSNITTLEQQNARYYEALLAKEAQLNASMAKIKSSI